MTSGRRCDSLVALIETYFPIADTDMDNSAEYWRRALAAHDQARRATNETDRAAWRRIAESFTTLFRQVQSEEAEEAMAVVDFVDAATSDDVLKN